MSAFQTINYNERFGRHHLVSNMNRKQIEYGRKYEIPPICNLSVPKTSETHFPNMKNFASAVSMLVEELCQIAEGFL